MSFSDLPSVRDIPGKVFCHGWCTCDHDHVRPEEVEKDPRLKNWEKWSAVRKKLNDDLSEALDRGPCRTLINSGDDLRTIKEEKAVLEYVNIPYPHDKYRGSPAFWRTPVALPDLCDARRPSEYMKVMTKEERCEIPEMEYVKVPDHIKAEMGYHCWGVKEALRRWNASEYRQHRVEALKNQMSHVEPFKPHLNQLYVEGKVIKKERWEEASADMKLRLSIAEAERTEEPRAEYYVQVNDVKITATSANTNEVYVTFDYDSDSKRVATKFLKVNNATPVALRYHFERCGKHSLFKDIIPQTNPRKVFFFDMNEGIIAPNNTAEIPIWFETDRDGIHKEAWKFCTRPAVWTNDLIIVFEAVALSESLEEKCGAIKRCLNEKAAKRAARKTIDDMLCEIPRPEGEPVLYTYDRSMIFEAVNQNYDPFTRRPKYLYDRSLVDHLEAFYARVKLPAHPDKWSYSVEDLRNVTKQRECHDYDQRILLEIESVKKGERNEKEPPKQTERSLSAELEEIIMKLERPSVWVNLDRNKFEWTYQILCACVDKICEEMDELNATYSVDRTFKYPKIGDGIVGVSTERTAVEFFEDALTPGPFRTFGNEESERRPPECLKDIPMEDTMKRYKTYFGIPDGPEKPDKKKKGKKGKEKKEKKKSKDTKPSKGKGKEDVKKTTVEFKINENFDPYGKIDIPSTPEAESISSESQDVKASYLQPAHLQEYTDRTYVIFYTNLESAIMRVCNVLEHQNHKQIKTNVFKTILESNKRLSKTVKVKAMDLKQAINESFDLQEKSACSPTTESIPPPQQQFWISEAIHRKEEGSLWSILRGSKQPEINPEKPIGYPEEQVIFKRRYTTQHTLNEVGTIMSNAGIDPLWEDFKDAGIQTDEDTLKGDDIDRQMYSELENVMMDVFEEAKDSSECPEICKCDEGPSDEDSFYDDEIPKVKNN